MGAIILDGVAVEVPGFDVRQDPMPIGLSDPRTKPIKRLVLHHDAALSAKSCKAILQKRKFSTHFCIDNDGTIVQFFDPAKRVSWHAGIYNATGVGIDVSNAVELKWASRYTPRRAEVEQRIHGIKIRGLAPYVLQQRALEALCCVLCRELGVPGQVPLTTAGEPLLSLLGPVPSGIIGHLHLTTKKWDPFGVDWIALQAALDKGAAGV